MGETSWDNCFVAAPLPDHTVPSVKVELYWVFASTCAHKHAVMRSSVINQSCLWWKKWRRVLSAMILFYWTGRVRMGSIGDNLRWQKLLSCSNWNHEVFLDSCKCPSQSAQTLNRLHQTRERIQQQTVWKMHEWVWGSLSSQSVRNNTFSVLNGFVIMVNIMSCFF